MVPPLQDTRVWCLFHCQYDCPCKSYKSPLDYAPDRNIRRAMPKCRKEALKAGGQQVSMIKLIRLTIHYQINYYPAASQGIPKEEGFDRGRRTLPGWPATRAKGALRICTG